MIIRTVADISRFPGAQSLRIPCIAAKGKNVSLLFECRYSRSDWAEISVILCGSTDGGENFDKTAVVADGENEHTTYNNPVAAYGKDGILRTVFCREYGVTERNGGVFCRDFLNGESVSPVRDISYVAKECACNVFAVGPTAGFFTSQGTFAVPVWYVPKSADGEITAHHPGRIRMLFGSENGEVWTLSEEIPLGEVTDPNESSAALLSDGRIYVTVRDGETPCRCFSVFDPETGAASPIKTEPGLVDPICCGAVCSAHYNGKDYLLLSNCADSSERRNLCVSVSDDGGRTWRHGITVTEGAAGYSDIAFDGTDTVLVFFESDSGEVLRLARVNIAEIIGE